MKLIIAFILSIFLISVANSGDYTLTISDDPNFSCAPPNASRENLNNPIRTSDEIAKDIHSYFRGEEPELQIFVGVFSNAHIVFCSNKEKENIFRAFLDVIRFDEIKNESHLYDYILMIGNKSLLKMIDTELSKKDTIAVKNRLEKVHEALIKKYE